MIVHNSSNDVLYQNIIYQGSVRPDSDRKIQAQSMKELKHRLIGLVVVKIFNRRTKRLETAYGTGFLIYKNLVMTARHVVKPTLKDKNKNQFHQDYDIINIKFFPGLYQKRVEEEGYQYQSYKFISAEDKAPTNSINSDDYMLIKLKNTVQERQFIKIGWNLLDKKSLIEIYGYPTKLQSNVQYGDVKLQGCQICDFRDDYIYHQNYTDEGCSGAPIILKQGDLYYFVGMHIAYNDHKDLNKNIGLIFNSKSVSNINRWIQQYSLQTQVNIFKGSRSFWNLQLQNRINFKYSLNMVQKNRINNSPWQTVCNNFLNINKKACFKVLNYHNEGQIIFGLLTKERIQKEYSGSIGKRHTLSFGFRTQNIKQAGFIVLQGQPIKGSKENPSKQLYLAIGDILMISICKKIENPDKFQVKFIIERKEKRPQPEQYRFDLPPRLQNRQLYPFSVLYKEGDKVQGYYSQ